MLEIKHHPQMKNLNQNDDNAVVSNDAKHMKTITNKTTKNDVVEDEDDDDGSHFSHISSTMLQSEVNHLKSLNYLHFIVIYSVQLELLMRQKQSRNKKMQNEAIR